MRKFSIRLFWPRRTYPQNLSLLPRLREHPSRTLKVFLASWVGKEKGFVCLSGHSAKVGLLQAIADEPTPVYLDSLARTSLR